MATKNKQIRSFYLSDEHFEILNQCSNDTISINKALQEILQAYADQAFSTPREKILKNTKKILFLINELETSENFKNVNKEHLILLTKQINEAVNIIQTNLNKI